MTEQQKKDRVKFVEEFRERCGCKSSDYNLLGFTNVCIEDMEGDKELAFVDTPYLELYCLETQTDFADFATFMTTVFTVNTDNKYSVSEDFLWNQHVCSKTQFVSKCTEYLKTTGKKSCRAVAVIGSCGYANHVPISAFSPTHLMGVIEDAIAED